MSSTDIDTLYELLLNIVRIFARRRWINVYNLIYDEADQNFISPWGLLGCNFSNAIQQC